LPQCGQAILRVCAVVSLIDTPQEGQLIDTLCAIVLPVPHYLRGMC